MNESFDISLFEFEPDLSIQGSKFKNTRVQELTEEVNIAIPFYVGNFKLDLENALLYENSKTEWLFLSQMSLMDTLKETKLFGMLDGLKIKAKLLRSLGNVIRYPGFFNNDTISQNSARYEVVLN